jgi:hypothetical protein
METVAPVRKLIAVVVVVAVLIPVQLYTLRETVLMLIATDPLTFHV